jgi:hypothetical protein
MGIGAGFDGFCAWAVEPLRTKVTRSERISTLRVSHPALTQTACVCREFGDASFAHQAVYVRALSGKLDSMIASISPKLSVTDDVLAG